MVATERGEEARVTAKVFRRLMWFLMLLFISSYLDRINLSFGALSMNQDLGLSATMFGLANSIFYATYVLCEIPSNQAQVWLGARIWIPRIMITWGMASAATALATGPNSLYVLRALVGLAEAGFMPGVLLYMTLWFPPAHRARAASLFIIAQPITLAFGSTLSGLLLDLNGFLGIAGWRWLFLIEGLPAVTLGICAWFYLDDSPAKARWLTDAEKVALHRALERREGEDLLVAARAVPRKAMLAEVLSLPIMLLSLTYFGMVATLSANSTWVPQIVRALLPHGSFTQIGIITAIPAVCAICVVPLWGARSDQRAERSWHLVLPLLLAAAGWLVIIFAPDPRVKLGGLVCCSAGTFAAQSVFWSLAPQYLSARARAVGIGLISTLGVSGSVFGPTIIGWLRDRTGSFTPGLLFVVASILVAVGCVLLLAWRNRSRDAVLASGI
jgi:ACS family 4-hydroxyphenylacetate permease-like MFS transporter